jgi:3-oxoacyl-[acyl-carrier protein] reductase
MQGSGLFEVGLEGKTALVCGASAGIGAAAAQTLAHLGAKVICLARDEKTLNQVVGTLKGKGHRVLACDLSDLAQIHSKVGKVVAELAACGDQIDILVNNSSGPKGGSILDAQPEEFMKAMTQLLMASQTLAQVLVPAMKKNNFGRIINVISTSVRVPIPGLGVSNTIRAATAGWAKTLANEVAPFGITVNSVLPGYTETQRLSSLVKAAAEKTGRTEQAVVEEWKKTTPAGRFAQPNEVAAAISFLASPAAGFITGVVLPVDGGRIGAI